MVNPESAPIYRIDIALIGKEGKGQVIQCGVETCCSTQIVDEKHVPYGIAILPCSETSISGANKLPLNVIGVAMLPIRIKTFEITFPFYVVKTLALPLLLGTPFIDAYIMLISTQEHVIRLMNGDKVHYIDHDGRAAAVRLVQDAYLAPMTETIVRCRTNRRGVSMLRSAHRRLDKICVAHGFIETEDGFTDARVANFSKRGRIVSAGTLLGVAFIIEVLTTVVEEEIKTVGS